MILSYPAFEMLMASATVAGHQLALDVQRYHGPHDDTCIFMQSDIVLCEAHAARLTQYLDS